MNDNLNKLNGLLSEVKTLGTHSARNAYALKGIHIKTINIINGIDKPFINRYEDILSGMQDHNNIETGIKNTTDYYLAKEQLLADIQDTIERYAKDNNLSTD